MGSNKSRDFYQGFILPDPRYSVANITRSTHPAAASSYSQDGPHTGTPELDSGTSRMVLEGTGTQLEGSELSLATVRGGHPGVEGGGFTWTDEANDSDPFGWDGPQIVTSWQVIRSTAASGGETPTLDAIRLQGGEILCCGDQSIPGGVDYVQTIYRYGPSLGLWASAADITPDDAARQYGPALLQLPSGRVLLFLRSGQDNGQVDVMRSDDDGATWDYQAYRVLDTAMASAISGLKAEYSNGEVILICQTATGPDASVYASDDLACQFTRVTASWAGSVDTNAAAFDVVASTGGGFVIIYCEDDGADTDYFTIRVPSAFVSASTSTRVQVGSGGSGGTGTEAAAVWRDEDLTLYAATQVGNASDDADNVQVFRSLDEGDSWDAFANPAYYSGLGSNTKLFAFTVACTGGKTALITRWTDASGNNTRANYSVAAIWLGGSATHTAPAEAWVESYQDTDYIAWSNITNPSAVRVAGACYLPVALPTNLDWDNSFVGASGAGAINSDQTLSISADAGDSWTYDRLGPALLPGATEFESDGVFLEFALKVTDGGDQSDKEIYLDAVIADGTASTPSSTWGYRVSFLFDGSGFNVYDEAAAASVGTVTAETEDLIHVRAMITKGKISVWYSVGRAASDKPAIEWSEGPQSQTLTDLGAATYRNKVRWGSDCTSGGDAAADWSMVAYCFWAGGWSPRSEAAAVWSSPESLHPRSYSTSPALVADGARVHASSGPSTFGESWTVEPGFDYPIANILPSVAPSPRNTWRGSNKVDNEIVFQLTGTGMGVSAFMQESPMLGLALFGINFKQAILQRKVGGGWVDVAEIDAAAGGFQGPTNYERYGNRVRPEQGATQFVSERFVNWGDFTGGTFKMDSTYRRIGGNTSGMFTNDLTKYPVFSLLDIDSADPTSGDCEVWSPNACAIVSGITTYNSQYFRLVIPAQTTAGDSYVEIGTMVVGPIVAFSSQYSWGRSIGHDASTTTFDLPDGSSRPREDGPVAREFEFGWRDGVDGSPVDGFEQSPDYIGDDDGSYLAAIGAQLYDLEGIFTELQGSVKPLVYLPRIVNDSLDQFTGPHRFALCRMTGSLNRQAVLGNEDSSELARLNTVTLKEIK